MNDRENNLHTEATQCRQYLSGSVPEALAHSNWSGKVARTLKLWSSAHQCPPERMWFLTGFHVLHVHSKMSQLAFEMYMYGGQSILSTKGVWVNPTQV